MPVFESNGNGITIPKWLLPIVLGLCITGAAAWAAVSYQAQSALPRIEAAQTYLTKADYASDRTDTKAWRTRVDDKLDRLLER